MRTTVSLIVIAFSLVAIGAGYFSGANSAVPASRIAPNASAVDLRPVQPVPLERVLHGAHSLVSSEEYADEGDAVVHSLAAPAPLDNRSSQIAMVLVGAGRSLRVEAPFLDTGVPLAVVISPGEDEAPAVAQAAVNRGDSIYALVDLRDARTDTATEVAAAITKARLRISPLRGVAVQFDYQGNVDEQLKVLTAAIRGSALRVIDLTGIDARTQRGALHFPMIARDVTLDARPEQGYADFMVAQALDIAHVRGRALVVIHPLPQTLGAVHALVNRGTRDGVSFTIL